MCLSRKQKVVVYTIRASYLSVGTFIPECVRSYVFSFLWPSFLLSILNFLSPFFYIQYITANLDVFTSASFSLVSIPRCFWSACVFSTQLSVINCSSEETKNTKWKNRPLDESCFAAESGHSEALSQGGRDKRTNVPRKMADFDGMDQRQRQKYTPTHKRVYTQG